VSEQGAIARPPRVECQPHLQVLHNCRSPIIPFAVLGILWNGFYLFYQQVVAMEEICKSFYFLQKSSIPRNGVPALVRYARTIDAPC
jgi:hypothetical protein